MTSQAPAGWYPDPSGVPGHRWWDGGAWSEHTSPPAAQPVAATPAPVVDAFGTQMPATTPTQATQPTPPWQPTQPTPMPYPYQAGGQMRSPRGRTYGPNHFALFTFGVVAIYLVIALTTRVVVFGILPLGLSLRSKNRGEPLALLAIGAAALSIVIAVVRLSHH
jgi:hypothetical protein